MSLNFIDGEKLNTICTAEANAIRAKTGNDLPINFDFANNKGFADVIGDIAVSGVNLNIAYGLTAPTDITKLWVKTDATVLHTTVKTAFNAETRLILEQMPYALDQTASPKCVAYGRIYAWDTYYASGRTYQRTYYRDMTTGTRHDDYTQLDLAYFYGHCPAIKSGNSIYIIAPDGLGYNPFIGDSKSAHKFVFCPGSSVGASKYEMPVSLTYPKAAAYDGHLYILEINHSTVDGQTVGTSSGYITDCNTNGMTFARINAFTTPSDYDFTYALMTAYMGKLYVLGQNQTDATKRTLYSINTNDYAVTALATNLPLINHSEYGAACACDNKLYFFGDTAGDPVYSYDIDAGTFAAEDYNVPISNIEYATEEDNAFYIGTNVAYKFSPQIPLEEATLLLYNGKVHGNDRLLTANNITFEIGITNAYIGGADGYGHPVEVYKHNGTSWVKITV